MKTMCVVILSCANFSDMWTNNIGLFEKYWPNHPDVFIISDGLGKYNIKEPPTLKIYQGEMSDRLIAAITDLDYKYVFLTFDDYYLCKDVNNARLNKLISDMDEMNADYCGIFKRPIIHQKKQGESKYTVLPLNKVYQVNFYPCIWKKDSLLKVLKRGEDIWKTEARLTRRARENDLLCFHINNKRTFLFVDIVRKGKYLISGKKYILKNGLFLSDRKTRSVKETVYLFLQTTGSRILPRCLKNRIKSRLKKKGRIFYSDFENSDE